MLTSTILQLTSSTIFLPAYISPHYVQNYSDKGHVISIISPFLNCDILEVQSIGLS